MVTKVNALKWVNEQEGKFLDLDGVYGAQCVDLPNAYLKQFWNITLRGNAINLLDSAKQKGLTVIYDAPGVNPKAGDIFVMSAAGHNFGHTGIVLKDSDGYTIDTLEQNVGGYADTNNNGINDQFEIGGKATKLTRNFSRIVGWIRPNFEDERNSSYKSEEMIRTTPIVGKAPYRQVHAHSTGNPTSTASGEASYMNTKNLNSGFYTHVVGNGRVIQVAYVGQGAWDVGGSWNNETFAAVELIESHKTFDEFYKDYKIYIELLKDLADQGNIPQTLDTGDLSGIKTHYHCTYNQPNNASDHVDPYPYLEKWGISKAQFKKDIENGISGNFKAEDTKIDYLDENITLKARDYPYYKGEISEDYYVEDENGNNKELIKKGTQVWVYEKKNKYSRINSNNSDQWIEDKYIVHVTEISE